MTHTRIRSRAGALTTNGAFALATAALLLAFLGAAWWGAGGWYPVHTWLAGAAAFLALAALLCFTIAHRVSHLAVSHHVPTPPDLRWEDVQPWVSVPAVSHPSTTLEDNG